MEDAGTQESLCCLPTTGWVQLVYEDEKEVKLVPWEPQEDRGHLGPSVDSLGEDKDGEGDSLELEEQDQRQELVTNQSRGVARSAV